MRIIVVDETGVRFHSAIIEEGSKEEYCSCSKIRSPRDILLRNDRVFITIPDKEYVSIILRKVGTTEKPLHQRNPDGISIYTTGKFMVMARFTNSYPSALQFIQKKHSLPTEEDKYIVSTTKIEKINPVGTQPTKKNTDNHNEIFVYESSFGDVFSGPLTENYTGELTSADQQMFASLKRSSYSTLDGSYPSCWT
jgi:hypothetical protein